MNKVSEIKQGAGYELKLIITAKQSIRKLWKCFSCGKQGMWRNKEEFQLTCPECGAEQSKEKGKGVWIQNVCSFNVKDDTGEAYLDVWNDDIDNYHVGDKVHLINCYVRVNESGAKNISKGKFGQIRKAIK